MRLVVADDSALLREGLVGLLERQGHTVVAQVQTAPDLLTAVAASVPDGLDLVLTDVRMPPHMTDDGLQAAVAIRRQWPQVGIMVISQYVAPAYATELLGKVSPGVALGAGVGLENILYPGGTAGAEDVAPGGIGYLLKDRVSRVADFLRSLGIVAAGGVVIDPEVAAALVQGSDSLLAHLTTREREVLGLMAEGLSNLQIAEKLVLSSGAVSKHVANVFAKLGLRPNEENRRVRAVLAYLSANRSG